MKKNSSILSAFAALLFLVSCGGGDDDPAPDNGGATSNAKADIYIANLNGIYETGVATDENNFITLYLNVKETGPYEITTSNQNGYKFTASGEFTALGDAEVKLMATGTPSSEQLDSVLVVTTEDQKKVAVQVVSNLSNKVIITRGGSNFGEGDWKTYAFSGRGELLWEEPGYAEHAVINNGIVYFSDGEALKALDAVTGAEEWSVMTLIDMDYITYADGVLYLADSDSDFWAVNATNGETLWTYDPASIYVPYGAPVVGDNLVYFVAGETIHAVNKTTGAFVWKGDAFACQGTPVLYDGKLYMSGGYSGAFAVNATTGEVLWDNNVTTFESPVLNNGRLYMNGYEITYCFDASNGTTIWDTEIADLDKSPVVYDEKVFVTTDFGFTSVYALSEDTGEEVWSNGSSAGFAESDIVAHKGMLYLGASSAVDGYYIPSGKIVTYFGGYGSPLAMTYGEILAVYDTDSGETAYPSHNAK
jgi:outer membrane protein assembly factor BamB